MKVTVYNTQGSKVKDIELSDEIFAYPWNGDLVHQVVSSQASNSRANTAHTKDRSEVSGGGKKPWQQKGTGRARHGSSRSPIWRHGGVTHGPRNDRNYKETIPKAMKNRALFALLSAKLKDGKLLVLDDVKLGGKTKDAFEVMQNLQKIDGFKTINWKKERNAVIYGGTNDLETLRSFRNLPNVRFEYVDQLNPIAIANTRYIVLSNPEKVLAYLQAKA
jgi:large subunit ribosomal protein L4